MDKDLTLLNDPDTPTRQGTSTARDTCPDLAFVLEPSKLKITWSSLAENLGSDHDIIQITVTGTQYKTVIGKARHTNWDKFRKDRTTNTQSYLDYSGWATKLKEDITSHTSELIATEDAPYIDNHLLGIWEARRQLTKRWKRQRRNKKLRKRIAELNAKAAAYASELAKENWLKLCDGVSGRLSLKQTWNILRHLIDPTKGKSEARRGITRTVNAYKGTHQHLMDNLATLYLRCKTPASKTSHPDYTGRPNSAMDEPISIQELKEALASTNKNSAPGADSITYKALANLEDAGLDSLLHHMNQAWEQGFIPEEWKHATVSFIQKPGKPLTIENLRPISLTSCVGKSMEKIIQGRLQNFLEETGQFPHNMVGFRPCLSTQDVLLQLKEDIFDKTTRNTHRAILALDLKGAFDNVLHDGILYTLNSADCGERAYNYIRSFLTGRTAKIKIGDLESETIQIGDRGTPQGAVLSPLLFNLALFHLPQKLHHLQNLKVALYADDITLWTPNPDSLGKLQDTLQEAADIITEHVHTMGLRCAPHKTELLLMKRGTSHDPAVQEVYLTIEGQKVYPTHKPVRILGLYIQANNRWTHQINLLKQQLDQINHMIRRVTTRHRGMREADTLRLVQAFAVSRIVYVAPYMNLLKAEEAKLDTIIRKATKTALHLPISASTQSLMEMGVHNTLTELVEAHHVNQLVRLGKTPTGRIILSQLNRTPIHVGEPPRKTPPVWRSLINVQPIPKNMHPTKHKGRREARAKALNKVLDFITPNRIAYTDAALVNTGEVVAVACIGEDNSQITPLRTTPGEEITIGEQVAIALAITQHPPYIVTDSQDACRAYLRGRICPEAHHILDKHRPRNGKRTINIIWAPSHTETEVRGNARAHHLAREEADARAMVSGGRDPEQPLDPPAPLTTYKNITKYYKEQRCTLPPPHHALDKGDQVKWRLLQTNTYPAPSRLNLLYPQLYPSPTCPNCQQARGTICHMVLVCPNHPAPQDAERLRAHPDPWETAIRSSDAAGQRKLITLADEACKTNGTLDVGTTPG